MGKSKMCYIIARKIKELEKRDDDLIKQIDELNEKLQKETDEEVKETLMYAIAFKQGASMAFGQIGNSLNTLISEIERY